MDDDIMVNIFESIINGMFTSVGGIIGGYLGAKYALPKVQFLEKKMENVVLVKK